MFTHSQVVDHGYVMCAEKVIQSLGNERLHVLPCLSLHKSQASLEIRVQVSPDMGLSFSAWGFVAACCRWLLCFRWGHRGAALRVTNLWAMPSKSRNTSRLTRDRRTSTLLLPT